MKNLKAVLLPIGLIAFAAGIVSFTNMNDGEDDKKCTIKIVKIVNGVETVTDSTFDCSEDMNWISSLEDMAGPLKHMMKVMVIDGDSSEIDFDFDFDTHGEDGVKVMKFKSDDGEEVEMDFDVKMLKGEGGVMKMVVNGKEIEINMEDLHKHMGAMGKDMEFIHENTGNIEISIDSDEDGKEAHSVKIIKSIDDDGNVTVKKIVNGVETELDEGDMENMHKKHKMMFIGNGGTMTEDHNMTIDVKVDGKEEKHIVIISSFNVKEVEALEKDLPQTATGINKNKLELDELTFSPNPNDGRFNLNFSSANTKKPVTVKIFDLQGKEIYTEKVNKFSGKYSNHIDISEFGKGTYLLQIVQGNKSKSSKVLIK